MSVYNLPVVGTNASPTNNTEIVAWQFLRQLWQGVAERAWLTEAGGCVWPRASRSWETGTVPTNVTEVGFTDSGKTWCGGSDDVSGFTYRNPWGCGLSGSATDCFPTSWFLCIDDYNPTSGGGNDPSRVIRTPITGWSNTGSLHFQNVRDYFVSGQLGTQSGTGTADVSGIAGKAYRIVGYPWAIEWSERVLEFPNDVEYASGTVSTSSHSNVVDLSALMVPGAHAGRDLLVSGDDGRLKRVTLAGNGSNGFSFAAQNFFPATNAAYSVVGHGNRAVPGRSPTLPYTFYRGIRDGFYSHNPDDSNGGVAQLPAATKTLPLPDGFGGCGVAVQAWDADVFTDQFACDGQEILLCGASPDRCYSPDLFKTIHGLQLALEALSFSYVEDKSYDGASYIPFLNPAEMFKLARDAQVAGTGTASLQVFSGTTGAVSGLNSNTIAVSGVTLPYTPIQVHYSIHVASYVNSSTGAIVPPTYKAGRGYMPNNTTLVDESFDAVFLQAQVGLDYSGDDGRPVIISPGWSQFEPLEFARLFDEPGVLIPDTKDNGFGTQIAVDPPAVLDFTNTACLGVGTWLPRARSGNYLSHKDETQSWAPPQGFARENGPAFGSTAVVNVARFAGTGFFDPGTATSVPTTGTGAFIKSSPVDPTAPYYERFYVGQLSPQHQRARDAQLVGTISSGGTSWLQDPTKDWYDFQWFGGVSRTESGTATAGSTTSLTDSTKASGSNNCTWAAARWGGAGPFVNFPVEVDFGAGTYRATFDPRFTETRLVTTGTTNGVLNWLTPLLNGSASGKPWRVQEPYKIGRYNGRSDLSPDPNRNVTLLPRNPTNGASIGPAFSANILGNGRTALFFSAPASNFGGVTNLAGWGFRINDPGVGGVYRYDTNTSSMVLATGTDSARICVAVPANFHADAFQNLPAFRRRFGRTQYGNLVSAEVLNEIYYCLKVLTAAKWSIHWTQDAVDGVDENNSESESATSTLTYAGCTSVSPPPCTVIDQDAKQKADALWGTNPVAGGGLPPYACVTAQFSQFTNDCHPCGVSPADGCSGYGLARLYSYGEIDNLCRRQASSVTMYGFALCCNGAQPQSCGGTSTAEVIFNANGDPVLLNAWKSFGGLPTGIRSTGRVKLGSTARPSGSLPNGTSCRSRSEGYQVADQCAVVKGNVPGGFTVIDPPGALSPAAAFFWWWMQGA